MYVSGSPAEVPTTSMHSSPSPIAKHSSPLPKLQEHQATNQTPVTMLGIQDYLANKAGEPTTTAAKRNHQIPQPSKPSSSGTQREQSYYKKSPQKSDQKTGHRYVCHSLLYLCKVNGFSVHSALLIDRAQLSLSIVHPMEGDMDLLKFQSDIQPINEENVPTL